MINEENQSCEILERKWYDEGIFKFSINYYFGCLEKEFGDSKLDELIQKKTLVSFSFFDSSFHSKSIVKSGAGAIPISFSTLLECLRA